MAFPCLLRSRRRSVASHPGVAPAATLLVALLTCQAAHAQQLRHDVPGNWSHSEHGSVISPRFGDPLLAGYKIHFLIGAPLDGSNGAAAGKVTLAGPPIFGTGGLTVVRTHTGSTAGARFGRAVVFVGDIDGDQCSDYAIGAPGIRRVFVHSGASGALLRTLYGPTGGGFDAFGHSLAAFDAVQGDGQRDLAVGAPFASEDTGAVYVYSLSTGSLRGSRNGETVGGRFGWSMDAPAFRGPPSTFPVDAKREKVLIGAPRAGTNERGRAYLVEGDGTLWSKSNGSQDFGHFGEAVCANDDRFYIGAPDAFGLGRVLVYSAGGPGQLGSMLYLADKYGAQAGERFGALIVAWRHTTFLDNNDRIAVGSPGYDVSQGSSGPPLTDAGCLRVFGPDPGVGGASWSFATANTWTGTAAGAWFGSAACGDVPLTSSSTAANYGVVGAPHDAPGGFPNSGSVRRVVGTSGQLVGTAVGGETGAAVAGIGDIDGDGRADFAIGSPDEIQGNPRAVGVVRLHSGATGAVLRTLALSSAGTTDGGASSVGRFGAAIAGIGDVNGDGTPDVLVGAPKLPVLVERTGMACVFSGATGKWLYWAQLPTTPFFGEFGTTVAGGLDIDGDARPDFAIRTVDTTDWMGSPSYGAVHLFSGATGMFLRSIQATSPDQLGAAMAFLPDIDGDGRAELALGAPHANSFAGVVRVVSGASGVELFSLSLPGSVAFGRSLAVGDVSGDGVADILVGASMSGSGLVAAFSGASGSLLYMVPGTTAGDMLGMQIAWLGDLDGDNRGDFAATAQGGYPANGGAVRVFSGATGAMIHQVQGTGAGVVFGASLANAGDVDGDGLAEWIAGAPMAPGSGTVKRGMARVYSSR